MKKILALVLILLLAFSALTGCANNTEAESSNTASNATQESTAASDSTTGRDTEVVSTEDAEIKVSGEASAEEAILDDDIKLAFYPNTQNNSFQVAMHETLKSACENRGWEYACFDPDYDLNLQLSQMADGVIQGFDVVVVIPVDPAGIREGLQAFKDAGSYIINIDTAVIDEDMELCDAFITTDCYGAGVFMGEQCAQDFPDGAQIAILHFFDATTCWDRANGFKDGLGDLDKWQIVTEQDGKAAIDASLPVAEDIINAHPDLDAFFCINDPSAMGAVAAIEAAGKTGEIAVYSIDASPEGKELLVEGKFTGVAAQVPIAEAELAVELLDKLVQGYTLDQTTYALASHNVSVEEAKETAGQWQ